MKAVRIYSYHGPESLHINELSPLEPGPGEVLIQVKAAGINNSDLQTTYGTYRVVGQGDCPHCFGQEAAGTILAVGPGVTALKPGMDVFGRVSGAFAQQALGAAAEVLPLPRHLSFEVAASLPIAYLTASLALVHKARVQVNEWVLVHPGSGGVGSATIQLAKLLNARVIATTSSNSKIPYLFTIGADEVLIYGQHSIQHSINDDIARITRGGGVPVAIDGGGQLTLPQCLSAIANGGRIVSYGYTTGLNSTLPIAKLIGRNASLFGIALWDNMDYTAAWATLRDIVIPGIINKQIRPVIHPVAGLEGLTQALLRLEQHRIPGKMVLVP